MIRAIVFDWGGVLIDEPTDELISYCADVLGVDKKEFGEKAADHFYAFQKGLLPEKEFWEKVCAVYSIAPPLQESLWGEAVQHVFRWREDVTDFAIEMKEKGYAIAFLSNTEQPAAAFFKRMNRIPFDVTVLSCYEGCRKPEEEIYEILCSRLEMKPEEVVFLDDRHDYVEGSKNFGINTILFENLEQAKEELKKLGVKV